MKLHEHQSQNSLKHALLTEIVTTWSSVGAKGTLVVDPEESEEDRWLYNVNSVACVYRHLEKAQRKKKECKCFG